jgi:hypothetical protein
VIAATAIVVGILDVCNARRIGAYRLTASGVALDQNLVGALLRWDLRDSGEGED